MLMLSTELVKIINSKSLAIELVESMGIGTQEIASILKRNEIYDSFNIAVNNDKYAEICDTIKSKSKYKYLLNH
jgi:sporulation-control protein spo0M